MTDYFESIHTDTGHLHHEGKSKDGKPLILDTANLGQFRHHQVCPYETMVMKPRGAEIAVRYAATLAEAEKDFAELKTEYFKEDE